MLTVAISKRNKLQNIIVLTPKDGPFQTMSQNFRIPIFSWDGTKYIFELYRKYIIYS